MSASKSEQYTIQWQKFRRRFILWFICIPINTIPIFLKHIRNISPVAFGKIPNLMVMIVSDLDLLFVSLSVVLGLGLEGFLAEGKLAKIYYKFQYGVLIYVFSLLILYTYFFFQPDIFSLIGRSWPFKYNSVIITLTVVLGIFCNATISMERSVRE